MEVILPLGHLLRPVPFGVPRLLPWRLAVRRTAQGGSMSSQWLGRRGRT